MLLLLFEKAMNQAKTNEPTNKLLIKEKIKSQNFLSSYVSENLFANCSEIRVDDKGPILTIDQNGPKGTDQRMQMSITDKLKLDASGEWDFSVSMIHSNYFDSREEMDLFFCPESERQIYSDMEEYKHKEKISINEAFEVSRLEVVSANLDYYSKHPDELRNDLGRDIAENITIDEKLMDELFYKQMCKIFGGPLPSDGDANDRKFMLSDFHLLEYDGNSVSATAQRGQFYVYFSFVCF